MLKYKKFRTRDLFVAPIVRPYKEVGTKDGNKVNVLYNFEDYGVFKRIGKDKFFQISTGIIFEKFSIYKEPGEFYVDISKGYYLPMIFKQLSDKKIFVKDIVEIETELNKKSNEQKQQENEKAENTVLEEKF